MSLIEQAAKRLEELRRAGVSGDASAPVAPQHEDGPSVEQLVVADKAAASTTPRIAVAPVVDARHAEARDPSKVRRIDLDLDSLRARGFVTPDATRSQIADEYRVIKRPILRNARDKAVKNGNLVMVTSSLPGEGKTFNAINLALSIATEVDTTVLLVDGDVANPDLPDQLGIPNEPGLLDVLRSADVDIGDVLLRTSIENLSIIPAGARHRRATELLASEQMANLLLEIGSRYADRIIVFDSPPLLPTTEARVLATHMGQIVMVVAADNTRHQVVNLALNTIEQCDIVLMVLNKADKAAGVGSYYGYYPAHERD